LALENKNRLGVTFLNIDRSKLNSLLKSGLNPGIKTRKQLAAELGLDPTSLTRWFSNRDRLGNPRHPVVPDRHVTRLLKIFDISSEALELESESFHQYCFDLSMQRANDQETINQKAEKRSETISRRKIDIATYIEKPKNKRPSLSWLLFSGILILGTFIYFTTNDDQWSKKEIGTLPPLHSECWKGYSKDLGKFEADDPADPCHYAKLYQAALMQLSQHNKKADPTVTAKELDNKKYLNFLSEQLDHRRTGSSVYLNLELGKSALRQGETEVAQRHLQKANVLFSHLPSPPAFMQQQISNFSDKLELEITSSNPQNIPPN